MNNSRQVSNWPSSLWLIRHGQSAGNVAAEAAELGGLANIDIALRDVDVPLSELGERQAKALGEWIAAKPPAEWPSVILSSPYERAMATGRAITSAFGAARDIELVLDERLRERELGIIDRFTKKGIIEKFPEQAELRARIGKFYYRPPGGESWCDVVLRLRSVIDTLSRDFSGERVMICCHSMVILGFRYLLEKMTEAEILKIDREALVANCSLTSYHFPADERGFVQPRLEVFNFVTPMEEAGEKITRKEDRKDLPK